ncbi:uncharacterized protein [Ptychodera flava]|uniref:uncharacterized protein n=1 Tax=Ptychodera flava TaxID=63121 RepID=UPI00396A5538
MVYVIYRRWCLKSTNQMREEHTRMREDDLRRRLSAGNTPAVTRREARDAARYFAFVNPIGGLNRNTPDTSHDAAALQGQQQNITDTRLTAEYESLGPANTPSTLGESTSLHMEEQDTRPSSFNPYAQVDNTAVVGAFSAVANTRNESDQGAYGPSEPKTYAQVDKKKDSATDKPDDGSPLVQTTRKKSKMTYMQRSKSPNLWFKTNTI